ncbi:DUF4339 domain-containing protein [Tsukamurella sp. M9C]|nr:DUF4339 domain-containing protein [Tsukamurella sp. M9C]
MGQQFAQNFQNQQQAPAQGAPQGAAQPGPPPLPNAQVFHVEQNGQSAGPFPVEQLRAMNLTPQTLVWSPALTGWTPAGQVPALASLFGQTPPPLPPRS